MSIEKNYANLKTVAANMPSLGLAYVYSAFEEAGCDTRFNDYQGQNISLDKITDYIASEKFDFVGMQTYITNINMCFEIASLIKEKCRNTRIVLGGSHATIFPDMVISHPSVDFVCISEAEKTVKELVSCLNNQKEPTNISGLYYKDKNGKIYKPALRDMVEDLDTLPIPKYEMFNAVQYFPAVHIRGSRVYNIITSRGCPFKCTFCAATKSFRNSFRYQSVDRTITEMKFLKEKLSIDSIQIYDDNFTTNKNRVKELCKRMVVEELGLQWVCYTRADALGDEEMLHLMKEAGCYMIVVGIENGNERILKLINKQLKLDVARKNIGLAKKAKIKVLSSFMIGLPTETYEEIENSIRFSISLGLAYATFPIFTPYPGTPIYEKAKQCGKIIGESFDAYSRWGDGIYESAGLTTKTYKRLQKKAFRKFYFRPKIFFKLAIELFRLPVNRRIRFLKGGLSFLFKQS